MKKDLFVSFSNCLSLNYLFRFSALWSLFFVLTIKNTFSQVYQPPPVNPPAIQWQKCIGGSKDDKAKDILVNADGSMIIVGSSTSNDGNVTGHHGSLDSTDAWVAKLDAYGNLLWQRSIGGIRNDSFTSVINTGDGNYLCIGSTRSTDGDISFNNGASDFLIVKVDNSGNILWSKCFGGTLDETANDGVVGPGGGYVIIGTADSYDGDVQSKGFGRDSADAWVIKLDAIGTLIWENTSGADSITKGEDIIVTHDNKLLVCLRKKYIWTDPPYFPADAGFIGYDGSLYNIDKDNGSFSYYGAAWGNNLGYALAKRNNGVMISWSSIQSIPYPFADRNGIITNNPTNNDEHSDINLALYNNSSPDNSLAPLHGIDPITDSSFIGGGFFRAQVYYDPVGGNTTFSDNAYLMIGRFKAVGPNDYDRTGTYDWGVYGGTGEDQFTAVKTMPNGEEYIAAGYTSSKDGDVSGNHGGSDCWIVKFASANKISGNVFIDYNKNGTKDNGEPAFDDAKVSSVKAGDAQYAIPSQGSYTNVVDTGTYTTTITINKPYYTSSNTGEQTTFTSFGSSDTVNFPVMPIPGIKDYAVSVVTLQPARPNVTQEYLITYSNKGTDTLTNRTVYFIKDNRSQFGYATPSVNTISGDTLSWNVTGILPGASGVIKLYVKFDPIPQLMVGDSVLCTASIDSTGDVVVADNFTSLRQLVVGSFDPNDKQESHGGYITPKELVAEKYLNYTIRFQNLGNEAATSIIVRDTLDVKLDAGTIEMTGASHPYKFTLQYGKYAVWTFDNINLIDSATNDSLSRGYISYRIKPVPSFTIGDTVRNSASIYFDFNPPVATNTTVTVFKIAPAVWTGAISKAWENPLNWASGKVPDSGTDVFIDAGTTNSVEISSNAVCRKIHVNPAAAITVKTGYSLKVGD